MNSLIVCNTGSDNISKISLVESLNTDIICEEILLTVRERPLGPNGIYIKNNIAYITNSYSNSISILNMDTLKDTETIYIGANPNDLIGYGNSLYIVCSESNAVVLYDLEEKKIILEIKTNNWPYNIEISKELGLLFITNFQSHNISIIRIITNKVIGELKTLEYPTKVKVSEDGKQLYVCESYMGDEENGYIEIFDLTTLKSLGKIEVGKVPIDIIEEENILYVCNLIDSSIFLIDKINLYKMSEIKVGGMPRAIVKYKDILYISDYLNGRVICLDLRNNDTKAITVGKEPNAMTLN
ncbi:YncE family protein [Clostridium sp. AL.422]|uniref:YncE family protein n=1 Tax=Clostridium TaxID=1485 RepID=UPI00293DF503|nr:MULTISPECIES: YncE family protein [unclassified Clostridium]MDV4150613.1 YncE family protein [Clostridium sp. AL.422]